MQATINVRTMERRADWGTDHNKADGEGPLQQRAVLTRGWAAMVAGKGRSEKVRTGRAKQATKDERAASESLGGNEVVVNVCNAEARRGGETVYGRLRSSAEVARHGRGTGD
jgi:hypothetical protein